MIKAGNVGLTQVLNRIDVFASTLGYSFVDGKYVKGTPVRRARFVTATPGKTTRRRFKNWPKELYHGVMGLTVGQRADITAEVKASSLTLEHAIHRIATWSSRERAIGSIEAYYRVYRADGKVYVERTA